MKELQYNANYDINQHNHYGILPKQSGGYYAEYLVINYTDGPIYIQTAVGEKVQIEHSYRNETKARVEIWRRSHKGLRKFKNGGMVEEAQDDYVISMTIDWNKYYNVPTYVKEFNIMVYGKESQGVTHPELLGCYENSMKMIYDHVHATTQYPPMTIIANDPDGCIKNLYVEINEYICEIPVNYDPNFTEEYVLCLKNSDESQEYEYISLSAKDIKTNQVIEQPVGDYSIFKICSSKEMLIDSVVKDREKRNNLINRAELKEYKQTITDKFSTEIEDLKNSLKNKDGKIKLIEDKHANAILEKDNEIDKLSRRLDALQKDYEIKLGIKKTNLDDKKCDIDLETSELNHQTRKEVADMQSTIAELKVDKEKESNKGARISTFGTAAKTAAIVAPIVVGIGTWIVAKYTAPAVAAVSAIKTVASSSVVSGVVNTISNVCTSIFSWFW